MPTSPCQLTDNNCICTNPELAADLQLCLVTSCTVKEQLRKRAIVVLGEKDQADTTLSCRHTQIPDDQLRPTHQRHQCRAARQQLGSLQHKHHLRGMSTAFPHAMARRQHVVGRLCHRHSSGKFQFPIDNGPCEPTDISSSPTQQHPTWPRNWYNSVSERTYG